MIRVEPGRVEPSRVELSQSILAGGLLTREVKWVCEQTSKLPSRFAARLASPRLCYGLLACVACYAVPCLHACHAMLGYAMPCLHTYHAMLCRAMPCRDMP
jgi:hypothetical protein